MWDHSDYDTVARAIRFLREAYREQPSLDEVASHVGLSASHFQRVFTRWAGVSPKRFLQFLTAEDAKERLRRSESVLQASFGAGLSGPARLHDLLVNTEAVTPGEMKSGGAGIRIDWGVHETPFGPALIGVTDRGVCHLTFLESDDLEGGRAFEAMRADWPGAELRQMDRRTGEVMVRIFRFGSPPSDDASLSLLLKGTNFQLRVWTALLRIRPGHLTTYSRLASGLGKPGGARAVGSAVGRNAIAYLIPCHRVIREDGGLGGYRWGEERKGVMLGFEAAAVAP